MAKTQQQSVASQSTVDDVLAKYLQRVDAGEAVDREAFVAEHPEAADALKSYFAGADEVDRVAGPVVGETVAGQDTAVATESVAEAGGAAEALPAEFGRYRVVRTLGRGAMGAVYLAHDTQLDRQVALKIPTAFLQKGAPKARNELMQRFDREAKAAATLSHPNICPVYDVGEIDGRHFISMGYIEGRPLSDFINPQKPQAERQVAAIVRKLALALEEAHQKGVVHRDVKPANIMIDQRSEPIIMDFGLAQTLSTPEEARVTRDGMIVGTPAYMSPEQVRGEVERVGPAVDVYSLGVVMYELLTGRLPFAGSMTEVIARILHEQPPDPSAVRAGLDGRLEAICLKMMDKQIEARHKSMAEVARALTEYLKTPQVTRDAKSSERSASPAADAKSSAQGATAFDPYHKWLGIPPREQPANHYRLLGIDLYEADLDVIEAAAVRQMTYVRQCAIGPHAAASQSVLNALSEAQVCLLNPDQKAAYDARLKQESKTKEAGRKEPDSVSPDSPRPDSQSPALLGDAKLKQQMQKLDKQKQQVESLLGKSEFAAAIDILEKMAGLKHPQLSKYAKWARQQLPRAKRGPQEMRESSEAMHRTAEGLFERNEYEEAAALLQEIPQKYRSPETRELLQECLDLQEELAALQEDIDHAEAINKYGELMPTVKRLLEIKPHDKRARRLLKELNTYGKGGNMRLGGRRDGRFDAAGDTSSPIKTAMLVVIPLALFAAVSYATVVYVRSNNQTIKIEIDDPSAKVLIDGETVKITGVGDTITLKPGKHELIVERGDTVVHTRQFEVVKGKNPVLRITLEDERSAPAAPTVAGREGPHTLTNALPVTIPANDARGYQIGAVKAGTAVQLQYVSGMWKGWGSRADISPDNTQGRGDDACFLAIVDFPEGDDTTGKVLKLVPEGTVQTPFTYVLTEDAANLVLRINDRGDGWEGNPGSVQYKVIVAGKSVGGVGASATPPDIPGLVAYYPLDETEGTAVKDASGNNYHGVLKGQPEWVQGQRGNALKLVGKTVVDLGQILNFEWSDSFSIGAWIQQPGNGMMVILLRTARGDAYRGYDLMVNSGKPLVHLVEQHPGDYLRVVGAERIPPEGWHHVMMTYDGSAKAAGVKIYVDGKLQEVNVTDDRLKKTTIKSDAPLTIGQDDPSGKVYEGSIDDLQIYSRELSAAEVQRAMSPSGKSQPSQPTGRFAAVQLSGAEPQPLTEGDPDFPYSNFPEFVKSGFLFWPGGNVNANTTKFDVASDGIVYMVLSGRPGGGGNASGGWKEKITSPEQIADAGWKPIGKIDVRDHPQSVIYERHCKKGESFTYSWEKYIPPVLLVPDGSKNQEPAVSVDGPSRIFRGHTGQVYAVAWSSDGRRLVSSAGDGTARLWDVESGSELRQFKHSAERIIFSVAISPDGRQIATSGPEDNEESTVYLWDAESGEQLRQFKEHTDAVQAVAFSPDGRLLASGGRDSTARLWDLENGAQLGSGVNLNAVAAVGFSPDGKTLFVAADNVYAIDAGTGRRRWATKGHTDTVLGLDASSDGGRLLSASKDKTVRLWNTRNGREIRQFTGHTEDVAGVAFLADEKHAVSGSYDGTLRFWDVESGQEIDRLESTTGKHAIRGLALSPDGRSLATAGLDGQVRVWQLPVANTTAGAAEWVLSMGGSVTVEGNVVKEPSQLPARSYVVHGVELSDSKVTDAEMPNLLPLTSLQSLGLNRTSIGDDSVKVILQFPDLRDLGIDLTKITNQGFAELAKQPRLTTLFAYGMKLTDEDMQHIAAHAGLANLILAGNPITDRGLESLEQLPELHSLQLQQTSVSDEGLGQLQRIPKLRLLYLGGNLTNAGVKHLAQLPNLRFLRFYTVENITDESLDDFIKLNELNELYLIGSGVTQAGADRLKAAMPNTNIVYNDGSP